MAQSSLLGIDPPEPRSPGHDDQALGPSDSSDSGSDLAGLPVTDADDPQLALDWGARDIATDRVFTGPGGADADAEPLRPADVAAAVVQTPVDDGQADPDDDDDEDEPAEEDENADPVGDGHSDADLAASMAPRPGRPNPEPDPPEDPTPAPAEPGTPAPGDDARLPPGRDPAARRT
jgi:hypothetical protein